MPSLASAREYLQASTQSIKEAPLAVNVDSLVNMNMNYNENVDFAEKYEI